MSYWSEEVPWIPPIGTAARCMIDLIKAGKTNEQATQATRLKFPDLDIRSTSIIWHRKWLRKTNPEILTNLAAIKQQEVRG